MPIITYIIVQAIPLEQGLAIGLVLMAAVQITIHAKIGSICEGRYGICSVIAIRNSSAAFVVAGTNFSSEYDVIATVIVVYMLSIIIMMIISGEIRQKIQRFRNV